MAGAFGGGTSGRTALRSTLLLQPRLRKVMGILPLQLPKEATLPALEPSSTITVDLSVAAIQPRTGVRIEIATPEQSALTVWTVAAIETAAEAATLMAGGFLPKLIADAVHESELAAGAAPH